MSTIEFDVDQFRQAFPEFSDPVQYPDATLQMYWDTATCFISDNDYGCLSGACRRQAINLLTAHLCKISEAAQSGGLAGQTQSATIDKVSVSLTPPPNKSQYSWWLNQTPYGAQAEALLSTKAVGGLYIGGRPETSAFRHVGGY